ncbi:MAG: hypothetical protein IPF92_07830 [Myxococcales bacterium]|nr:hypothetical protein [Myxococcales bacterium]
MKRLLCLSFSAAWLGAGFLACSSDPPAGGADGGPVPTATTLPDGAPLPPPDAEPQCKADTDCDGGRCVNGSCAAPSATDGVKNGDESDVDCGGTTAPRCALGKACREQDDCDATPCIGGECKKPSPTDGLRDNDETDVDCGGLVAPKCADGKSCINGRDCASAVCRAFVCRAPSITDGVKNGDETYIDCGGTKAPACAAGDPCLVASDCTSLVCLPTKACAGAYTNDGVKNGTETDVDCGGPGAPVCATGKECKVGGDCDSKFCSLDGGVLKCEPRKAGRKDGDETDIDCGGTVAPPCASERACLADRDCQSAACSATKKTCLEGPSCRAAQGGETCGTGEVGGAGVNHESCCRTLPVTGYSDPRQPGKTVYLDKYEVTAGRMRAFIAAVTAANGLPDVKSFMAARRPSRWVNGWEDALPASAEGNVVNFTVTDPTTNLLYPGQDRYLTNRTQTSWSVASGNFSFRPGLYTSLITPGSTFFPEYVTNPGWPTVDYAVIHAQNCSTTAGSYGYGTFYFDRPIVNTYTGGVGRFFTQDQMDVKALNCSTFGLYAAMCAWDGGQLATTEVFDYVSGNNSRLLVAGATPSCSNGINSGSDGITRCDGISQPRVYYYPPDGSNTYDGSARIAPPGRVAADVVTLPAGGEGWRDMKGNLMEAVLKPDNTFEFRGYGIGYGSVTHHRNQQLTPRMVTGGIGARCMRFK